MDPERWREVRAVFAAVLEGPEGQRDRILAERCAGDDELHREVASLLVAHATEEAAVDRPLVDLRAPLAEAWPTVGERYRIVDRIGRGGMGTVYRAERSDEAFDKQVALKVLLRGLDDPGLVARFHAERRILARLDHPNVARLLDGGTTADGRPFLVMELVEGEPLDVYCDRRRLPVRERVQLLLKVCRAVDAAHRSLIVHRDLKPGNILVTADGEPKLLDFGIAKLLDEAGAQDVVRTAPGGAPLTPAYASPEQLLGEPVSTATDVWALGVIAYRLLAERLPFELSGLPPEAAKREVCEAVPEPPSRRQIAVGGDGPRPLRRRRALSADLDAIVLTALAKEPPRRYPSAAAMAEDLERHLEGQPVRARGDDLGYRARRFIRRHRAPVAVALLLTASLLGALVVSLVQQARVVDERNRAVAQNRRAETVSAFMEDLFSIPDPGRSRGEQVTARQLLDAAAADLLGGLEEAPDVRGELLLTIGRSYRNLGLYPEAAEVLDAAVARLSEGDGNELGSLSAALHERAIVATFAGELAEATRLFRQALTLRRRILGPESEEVAETHFRLARALALLGRRGEARQHFELAEGLARRLAADDVLARTLYRFGALAQEEGDFAAARRRFDEALDLFLRLHGELHPEAALTLNDLGVLALAEGEYRSAEELARRAASLQRRLFGGDHAELAASLTNVALAVHGLGRLDEAEALFGEALDMHRRALGDTHPKTATVLRHFAQLQRQRGELVAAEQALREALRTQREALGHDHPEVGATLNDLGLVSAAAGELDEADALYREALAITRRAFVDGHAREGRILNNRALLARARGDRQEAERLFSEAADVLRDSIGAAHPDVALVLRNAGELRRAGGDLDGARSAFEAALAIQRHSLGDDHPETAMTSIWLADAALAGGDWHRALRLAESAATTLRETRSEAHGWIAAADRVRGESLLALGRLEDAEPFLVAEWRRLEAAGIEGAAARGALERLVRLFERLGRAEEAELYRERLARRPETP